MIRFPPPLEPGDRVGVAALSSAVDPERLSAGLAALTELGFEPVEAANLRSCSSIFAGGDEERLAAFHELATRADLKAIFFARGGHGVLRILPLIDWDLLARFPRAYVGYSDLTPFLLQVVARLGLVAFHGPMVATDLARGLDCEERRVLLAALAGPGSPEWPLEYALDPAPGRPRQGPLLGGCLSLLGATLGTPWEPRVDDAILFVEDLNEPFYRFDRLLTHLRLSGNLSRIAGLVCGHLLDLGADLELEEREEEQEGYDSRRGHPRCRGALREFAAEAGASFAGGLEAGHARPNLTLPLGATARLEPEKGRLLMVPEASRA